MNASEQESVSCAVYADIQYDFIFATAATT